MADPVDGPRRTVQDATEEAFRAFAKKKIQQDLPIALQNGVSMDKINRRSAEIDALINAGDFTAARNLLNGQGGQPQGGVGQALGALKNMIGGVSVSFGKKPDPLVEAIRGMQLQQLQNTQNQTQQNQNVIDSLLNFNANQARAQSQQAQAGTQQASQSGTPASPEGGMAVKSASMKPSGTTLNLENLDLEGQKQILTEKAVESERIRKLTVGLKEVLRGAEMAVPGDAPSRVGQRMRGVGASIGATTGVGDVSPKAVAQIKSLRLKVRSVLKNFGEGSRMSDPDVIQAADALNFTGLTTGERLALFEDIGTFVSAMAGHDPNEARLVIAQSVGLTVQELEQIITDPNQIDKKKMRRIRQGLRIFKNTRPGKGISGNSQLQVTDEQFAQALKRAQAR